MDITTLGLCLNKLGSLASDTETSISSVASDVSSIEENMGAFKKVLTQAETISTTAKTYTLQANSVYMILLLSGDNSSVSGLWFCRAGGSTIQYLQISKSNDINVSTSGLDFSIVKASGTRNSTIVIYQLSDEI